MRYIPKNKRSKPFEAIPGYYEVAANSLPYLGLVIETTSGKYFAYENGDINLAKKLYKVVDDHADDHVPDKTDYVPREGFYFDYVSKKGDAQSYPDDLPRANYLISQRNYTHGSYTRYFVKNVVTGNVFEIGPSTFRDLEGKSTKYHWPSYLVVSFDWKIAGEVADKEINGYIVEGVETLNKKAVEEVSDKIPELSDILIDYLEFHQ